jgi:hypothetical protein
MTMELAFTQHIMKQVVEQRVSLFGFQSLFSLGRIDEYKGKSPAALDFINETYFNLSRAAHIRRFLESMKALKTGGLQGFYRWGKEQESRSNSNLLHTVLHWDRMLADGAFSGYSALVRRIVFDDMRRRMLILGCALERQRLAGGTAPDSLDDLPKNLLNAVPQDLDGQPVRYRKTKNGWILWSVGIDLTDDWHGQPPPAPPSDSPKPEPTDAADWQWRHE